MGMGSSLTNAITIRAYFGNVLRLLRLKPAKWAGSLVLRFSSDGYDFGRSSHRERSLRSAGVDRLSLQRSIPVGAYRIHCSHFVLDWLAV